MWFLFVRPEICPRVSMFPTSGFLQIPPHDRHPCLRLYPSHYRADSGLAPVGNVPPGAQHKTPVNGIHTPLTRVPILISIRLFSTNFYAFICFANFPFFMFQSYIPETVYFTGFPVIFNWPISMPFQLHPPNFIFWENSFCFLKFPISDFSNLGDRG